MRKATPPEVRFFNFVAEDGDCWIWTGGKDPAGYGVFAGGPGGRSRRAHRWVYEYFIAEIPDGLVLDHLCRTPSCVNPWHLEPVTSRENTRRGLSGVLKTHCPQGHPFAGANLRVRKTDGARCCRKCEADKWQKWASVHRPKKPRPVRTHCKEGHALTEDNVRLRKEDGFRVCRACERERWERRKAAS